MRRARQTRHPFLERVRFGGGAELELGWLFADAGSGSRFGGEVGEVEDMGWRG